MCFVGGLHATGYYGPDVYLDDGGKNVDGSPEFYWGLELHRLAQDFHPAEKVVAPTETPAQTSAEETPDYGGGQHEAADRKELAHRVVESPAHASDLAEAG